MSDPLPDRSGIPSAGMGERRVAVRGVAWGGIESGTTALIGFLLTPLVVRAAGLEGLGLWGAAWSLAHAAGLVDLGIGASYGRFTARAIETRDVEALNGTLAVGVGFHLVLALLIGVPALLLTPRLLSYAAPRIPNLPEARLVVSCTIATVFLRATLSAYRGVVAGAQRQDLLGRIGTCAAAAEGVSGAFLLLGGFGLSGLAINSLMGASVTTFCEAVAAHRLTPGLRLRPFFAPAVRYREVLTFGSLLQVTRASEMLSAHAPRLLLAGGPGLAAAGAYDLAARAASVVPLLASLPLRVIVPLAGRLQARGDRERLKILVQRSTRYVAFLAFPPCALMLLDAGTILLAWTGQTPPAHAVASARLLSAAALVGLLYSPLRLVLRGCGHPGVETASGLAGMLTHLALAAALVAPWGARGAALAALLGTLVTASTLALLSERRPREIAPREAGLAMRGALLATLCLIATGLLLDAGAPLQGAMAPATRLEAIAFLAWRGPVLCGVFLCAAILFGSIRADDFILLREAGATRERGSAR